MRSAPGEPGAVEDKPWNSVVVLQKIHALRKSNGMCWPVLTSQLNSGDPGTSVMNLTQMFEKKRQNKTKSQWPHLNKHAAYTDCVTN
jgi:hypothetical protein